MGNEATRHHRRTSPVEGVRPLVDGHRRVVEVERTGTRLRFSWRLKGAWREDLGFRVEASRLLPANDNPENLIGVRLTARW